MNKLRDKTHIILIILVIAFIATIIFEWGMDYLGLSGSGQETPLGMVNGKEIAYKDFEARLQMAIEQQKQQTGEEPDEAMINTMREQIWDQMVTEVIAKEQIEKYGIEVTDQEIKNWVYNSPQTLPDPIKNNFIDSTGQFNMNLYQQVLTTQTPEIQKFWVQVEDYLRQVLLSQKLTGIVTSTVRVSEFDVRQKFIDENVKANVNWLLLDVNNIPDTDIQVTDEDLKNYYDKNKNEFKVEESAKLKYVLFSDIPIKDDSMLVERNMRALIKDLRILKDSSLIDFVNTNSENKWTGTYSKLNELSKEVTDFLFKAQKDSISDIIQAADGYHLVKYLDSRDGDVFVNASHILVSFGSDTNAARVKAQQIIQRAKNGEDFAVLASELSDDNSAKQNGGNLGWFTKGAMVKEFEDAALNGSKGELLGPVKTNFGFHIIKIHDKQNKEFKIADIKQTVKTTQRTRDIVLKSAEDFSFIAQKGNFETEARALNFQVQEIPNVTKGGFIPNVGVNSKITNFALKNDIGSVSAPVKIQNGYAVYYLESRQKEGFANFDEIKETIIKPKVMLEKKLDILKDRALALKGKISDNDLITLNNIEPGVTVQMSDSISVLQPNAQMGSEPEVNSILYSMQKGQLSEPIRTQRGYFIVQVRDITPFDEAKYQTVSEQIKTNILDQKKQTILQEWLADLKDKADIVDNRDLYFR